MHKQKRHASGWLVFTMGIGLFTAVTPDATACISPGLKGKFGNSRSPFIASGSALDRALNNWRIDGQKGPHSPERSDNRDGEILGMWVTKFYVGSTNELFDKAIQQFFPGGNELMNSALFPPSEGNICFGVWKAIAGKRTFRLRHIGWVFDINGDLQGVARINAVLTVTPQGDDFAGTYVSDVVDLNGNVLPGTDAQGVIKGMRFGQD